VVLEQTAEDALGREGLAAGSVFESLDHQPPATTKETAMSIEMTIHGTGTGTCSLTGKEGEGMTVSFKDGTVGNAFLSVKAFMQLVRLKTGSKPPAAPVPPTPAPPPVVNGALAAPK